MDKLAIDEALLQDAAQGLPEDAGRAPPLFMSPSGARRAVVSVPCGAPAKLSASGTGLERKFQFVSRPPALLLTPHLDCGMATTKSDASSHKSDWCCDLPQVYGDIMFVFFRFQLP